MTRFEDYLLKAVIMVAQSSPSTGAEIDPSTPTDTIASVDTTMP